MVHGEISPPIINEVSSEQETQVDIEMISEEDNKVINQKLDESHQEEEDDDRSKEEKIDYEWKEEDKEYDDKDIEEG
jgi:hypothetical protein